MVGPWRLAAALVAVAGLIACDSEPESKYPWAPDKPVTVIVPWAAGGSTDQVSRVVAGELETALGQKFVVVNQPGASGTIGKGNVWNAAHDGYTWAAGAPKQLGEYKLLGLMDTKLDDWLLYLDVTAVQVVGVNPDSPYQTMADLLEAMKAHPGAVAIATAGATSAGHLAAESIAQAAGIEYRHVTYDGGNPAVIATVAGETEVTTQLAQEQVEMIRAGRIRPLAVLAEEPLEIPDYGTVPPITDWLPDIKLAKTEFGLFAPTDIPAEVKETMDMVWEEKIANSQALKDYAAERAVLFTPVHGEEAMTRVRRSAQIEAWMLHAAGRTVMSPEELGIPKP
ncbi:MAG: hypothetical protein CMM50_09745 [Rhodospirillaceae bacterium]|nr:hypothetical protein [Rhodospirillaceae bacterium]